MKFLMKNLYIYIILSKILLAQEAIVIGVSGYQFLGTYKKEMDDSIRAYDVILQSGKYEAPNIILMNDKKDGTPFFPSHKNVMEKIYSLNNSKSSFIYLSTKVKVNDDLIAYLVDSSESGLKGISIKELLYKETIIFVDNTSVVPDVDMVKLNEFPGILVISNHENSMDLTAKILSLKDSRLLIDFLRLGNHKDFYAYGKPIVYSQKDVERVLQETKDKQKLVLRYEGNKLDTEQYANAIYQFNNANKYFNKILIKIFKKKLLIIENSEALGILKEVNLDQYNRLQSSHKGFYQSLKNAENDKAIRHFNNYEKTFNQGKLLSIQQLKLVVKSVVENGDLETAMYILKQIYALDALAKVDFAEAGEQFSLPKSQIKMSYIPSGKFLMGSPITEDNRDRDEVIREVEITKGFYFGTYEVTVDEYERVLSKASQLKSAIDSPSKELPMVSVSYEEAIKFCQYLSDLEGFNFRLSTEAEWEYACRAGTISSFNNIKNIISIEEANVSLEVS